MVAQHTAGGVFAYKINDSRALAAAINQIPHKVKVVVAFELHQVD
jgi:hypothetical protein